MTIIFTRHARQKMRERGASPEEVKEAILYGENLPVKHGRIACRKNFQYNAKWGRNFYHIKQVLSIAKKENGNIFIITVYTFYF